MLFQSYGSIPAHASMSTAVYPTPPSISIVWERTGEANNKVKVNASTCLAEAPFIVDKPGVFICMRLVVELREPFFLKCFSHQLHRIARFEFFQQYFSITFHRV